MWFKNLQLFRLTEAFGHTAADIEDALSGHGFRPCGGLDLFSLGWYPPLGEPGQALVHAANGCFMLCAQRQERLLPASVVNEVLAERVEAIQAEEVREVGRRERQRLREDLVGELLPKAFTRSTRIYCYIDPQAGWLIVDASSRRRAEDLVSLLRQGLGSLPVKPPESSEPVSGVLTEWVRQGSAPADFLIGSECELRDPEEQGAVVRCRRQDLTGEEIRTHLEAGKLVVRLAVEWSDRLSCILGDDLAIRRLRFTDLVVEEASESGGEDAAALFDADFALMVLELRGFLQRLFEVFAPGSEAPAAAKTSARAA
jgi:recombination associated protein RdgC